jgi:hypothetical protein
MARKSSNGCTEIKTQKVKTYVYEIGYLVNEHMEKDHIEASTLDTSGDELVLWSEIDGEEVQVGAFKNWVYFRHVPIHEETEK